MEYYALKDIIIILKRHEFGGFFLRKGRIQMEWKGRNFYDHTSLGQKGNGLILKGK